MAEGQRALTGVEPTESTSTSDAPPALCANPMQRRRGAAATGAALLLFILFALYAASPAPASITAEQGGAQINLASDDTRMLLPGGCFTVRWQTENVSAVFITGEATIGQDERTICGDVARLRILNAAEQKYEFVLKPQIIIFEPLPVGLLFGGVALLLVGVWLFGGGSAVNGRASGASLLAALIFLLALYARLPSPAVPLTTDEADGWTKRSGHFLAALQSGAFAETQRAYHPGVVVMWLGSSGMLLRGALGDVTEDYLLARATMLIPVTLVNALALAAAYVLLRRLIDPRAALLASIFVALSPFASGLARMLHTDALMSSFMTLSFLAALIALRLDEQGLRIEGLAPGQLRWGWWIISAVCAGLAALTKLTALYLALPIGFIALIVCWRRAHFWRSLPVLPLLLWGAILLAVWCALYPAAWVDPIRVLSSVLRGLDAGASPHENGNFFLGQPMEDPGVWFYPVALALRVEPWHLVAALIGLLPLARLSRQREGQVGLLAMFYLLLFIAFMAVQAKKFDRYILPAFPAIMLLAAYGWLWLAERIGMRFRLRPSLPAQMGMYGGLTALLLIHLNAYQPYNLTYFSPLLGGGAAAQQMIYIGWGDGLEPAAAYIDAHIDGCDQRIMTWYPDVLSRYLNCEHYVLPLPSRLADAPDVDYIVLYINQIQRGMYPELTAELAGRAPDHIVEIYGVEYAYIYNTADLTRQ